MRGIENEGGPLVRTVQGWRLPPRTLGLNRSYTRRCSGGEFSVCVGFSATYAWSLPKGACSRPICFLPFCVTTVHVYGEAHDIEVSGAFAGRPSSGRSWWSTSVVPGAFLKMPDEELLMAGM